MHLARFDGEELTSRAPNQSSFVMICSTILSVSGSDKKNNVSFAWSSVPPLGTKKRSFLPTSTSSAPFGNHSSTMRLYFEGEPS